ncbi:guanosine-3',5'-bis(diphosphate) 3'-pyrophosphohydrolase [gut metagenome]|uniref:Guanosine-3',5'-bis(Diphosphate) 3'-pyrophosphohydrolase n=1 Tax=gut metagenome TaxID=749906 RepID=J9F2Z9_9ZZZZ
MKNNQLTPQEAVDLKRSLLQIYRNEDTRPSKAEMLRLMAFVNSFVDKRDMRDAFGFHRVVQSLHTVGLAIQEIGLHGKVLDACVLASFCTAEEVAAIHAVFGPEVGELVESFLRVRDLLDAKVEAMKTENFRNLLMSKVSDMRVILLLIADCVNLMRQVRDTENEEAKRKLSTEAAYLYAPMAHKLGLYKLKSELEDLSLKYLEHDAYYMIKEALNATKKSRDAYIERFTAPIREMLDREGLVYHMKGRTKSIHSIWQKMKKQQCGFNGVYDLFAIRIILDAPLKKEKDVCWKVFSLITDQYESNLRRLRDWLTVPKSNGYESLHVTVLGPENKWVEVQIRTERMDEIAEHGLAAHWRYKGVKSSGGVDTWLADIRTALETGNEDLLTKSLSPEKQNHDIYVFTPKGDLYRLPPKATVLDFAYLIHSGVGNKCVGAKVNGKNVPIRQVLGSGETVEILTANNQVPRKEWLNIVVSNHARSKIRAAIRDIEAKESGMARELLERKMKNHKIEWDEGVVNQLIKKMGYKESNEFYKDLAEDRLDSNAVLETYQELLKRDKGLAERVATRSAEEYNHEREQALQNFGSADVLVIDRNLKGIDFQMARCCNPVYGDDVFGFVTVNGGIKIHRSNCPNAPALRERFGYRIVPARWAGKGTSMYPITLRVIGHDDLGIVNNITSIISKEEKIMLRSINIDSNDGLFSGILTVMVKDNQVLTALIKKISAIKGVKAVSRA